MILTKICFCSLENDQKCIFFCIVYKKKEIVDITTIIWIILGVTMIVFQ